MEKARILIVDDQEEVRKLLFAFLNRWIECEIKMADSGKSVLEELKKDKFDLILMDIKMPGLSGIDLIKEIMSLSPASKIIVISAYDSQEVADEAVKAGAVDYILKSYSAREMEIKIQRVLEEIGKFLPKRQPC